MTVMHRGLAALFLVGAALAGCSDSPKGRTYFERNIQPILEQKCAGNTSGCHAVEAGDPFAVAAGNLDVTTFENIQKRRDLLTPFGAYPFPLLLIKAVGDNKLKLAYADTFRNLDVRHSGGGLIDVGSDAYFTLQTWLENGATENGLKPASPAQAGEGGCSTAIPPGFVASNFVTAATQASFQQFRSNVQPILDRQGCTEGSCHGAPQSDFYITCGATEDQLAFNFSQAWSFVNATVDDSQLLRVPLAVAGGGRGHTGGDQFASTASAEYLAVRAWAEQAGELDFAAGDPVKRFFADRVQPVLLERGCGFQACHSPQAANDFKLRSGTPGFFSAVALEKNYDLLRNEFMALEFPDARRSRAVAKAILAEDPRVDGVAGIAHRGGEVLETPGGPRGAEPASCAPVYNPASVPPPSAFCTIQEWLRLERAALATQVTPMDSGDPISIVFVQRTGGATAGRLEFDTFQGGADLRAAQTTFGANQVIQPAGDGASILDSCGGLGIAPGADIQAPNVANDGNRVVFAARASAADPLGVFVVNLDGSGCARLTPAAPDSGGVKVHNFDPVWSPDGQWVVFASTRGKTGATRSRKRFLPQSDLWRMRVNGTTADQGSLQQVTFLSNSEIGPAFMREGRMTMTTEKASDGFYQLAGRRINWDLTDYHPLLAQRKDSPFADPADLAASRPSIGFSSATDIREASNGDFLLVLADVQASGAPAVAGAAGALAVFNRSVGPMEVNRDTEGFLRSLRIIGNAGATGRMGATAGYRRPISLPDGTIMAAYTSNPAAGTFDIVAVDPRRNSQRNLFSNAANRVDAVLAYRTPAHELYLNRRQLVFGGGADLGDTGHAVLHLPDAPMTFTLLTANLRRGRPVDAFRTARFLAVYSEGNCPSGPCAANTNGIYENRTLLGRAPLASDGSVRVRLPAQTGVVLELQDGNGNAVVKMTEEHQLGPAERISMGVKAGLFDAVCGGCHGSISGRELDIAVTPDALTGASASLSATADPAAIGP